jgi:2-phospho-L-lactate/phosphoenolpyruvate guanylyltransferase
MIPSGTWIVIPVKTLSLAKRRLAPVLPVDCRQRLVLTMLDDVLAAANGVEGVARILVVTPDPQVAAQVDRVNGAVLLEKTARGLNEAVRSGLGYARSHRASGVVVVPADVPLAEPEEIRRVVQSIAGLGRPCVGIVPSADGRGTNSLAQAPPDVLEPSFGVDSFVRHLAGAVARQLDVRVLHLAGLAADVDEPADLGRLLSARPSRYDFLAPWVAGPASRSGASGPVGEQ